ncbi:hypothetical protein GR160_13020 [Flavobacterium sp. Sd200]|uniref:hypothetical protein n=1 Tax=Flavobacterium sp. Sd200 TaxID=2692211 RepID=UPI001370CD71|nr:hypothetical protein [Flavobacterium sp. Sd200]MXN92149.1 hypothetical protein [Flavobacterium sp. Sd200]
MKKRVLTVFALASLSFAALTVSCSDDDNKPAGPTSTFVLDRNNFKGEIEDGEVILESGTYKLTGPLVVGADAKLTIKAGVIIEATRTTETDDEVRYIAIAQDGEIDVQGTAASPVVMTAEVKEPQAWGGLVLCGRATINTSATGARAEVSDLPYGGNQDDDSSGTIKYLRVEYPGFSYSASKEFNGVSFFGVGRGTTVEHVQVYESSDDGFEWFGGTVNTKWLSVVNVHATKVGDDLFDWTEGWVGTNENWYGKRTNGGNRGIEADNNANNRALTPISNPTITNLTLIGNNGGSENQAIKLREGTKAVFNNVVLSNFGTGFDVQHAETLAFVTSGATKATGVKFDNIPADRKAIDATNASNINSIFTENASATGAGAGTEVPAWAQGWTRNN